MTARIGHNRPPKPRDPRDVKLEMVQAITNSWAYTANEALALIGIIANSNSEYEARLTADQIMTYLKTKRKPTIWPVLRSLEKDHGVITRDGTGGRRANTYRMLPQRVIESVLEHYEDRDGRRVPAKKDAPNQYVERTGSGAPTSTPSVPVSDPTSTPSVPVRSANRYAERTGKGGSTSTPSVPVTSTPSVPVNAKKPNDSSCAQARVGARAATTTTTIKDSENPTEVGVVTPRVCTDARELPEIDGLNGNTARFVRALAESDQAVAIAGAMPDYKGAHDLLEGFVHAYGGDVVQAGCLQWQIGVAQKTMKNPFKSFANYIERVSQDRQKATAQKSLASKGLSSFSELIQKGDV